MKNSEEEANGWRDEHSKCVCVLGGGGGVSLSEVRKMQRAREGSSFLAFCFYN